MEEGEHPQRGIGDTAVYSRRQRRDLGAERRVHAVLIRIAASASLAAARAASREAPVASTIAALGRLSPAGGMMSPGFAVPTPSAMPGTARASSAPPISTTLPGSGKA